MMKYANDPITGKPPPKEYQIDCKTNDVVKQCYGTDLRIFGMSEQEALMFAEVNKVQIVYPTTERKILAIFKWDFK